MHINLHLQYISVGAYLGYEYFVVLYGALHGLALQIRKSYSFQPRKSLNFQPSFPMKDTLGQLI